MLTAAWLALALAAPLDDATGRLVTVAGRTTAPGYDDRGLDLRAVDLASQRLDGVDAAYSNFADADLSAMQARGANLAKCDFSGARLTGAFLTGSNLSRSEFSGADLTRADLGNANLVGAVFHNADLSGMRWPGATLSFADLRGARGLTAEQLATASWAAANPPRVDPHLQAIAPPAAEQAFRIDPDPAFADWVRAQTVVDGTAGFGRRSDPACTSHCRYEAVPFGELATQTAVDVGIVTVSRGLANVDRVAGLVAADPDALLIRNRGDLERALTEGRYGVVLYSQQVPLLNGQPERVRDWFDRGLRIVQPAYSRNLPAPHQRAANKLAGGADEPGVGLTPLGRLVVAELVRLNLLIDVSHLSEAATFDILAMDPGPVLATHANARTLTRAMRGPTPLGRNKSDRELKAIAATGGVVGLTTVGWMLDRDGDTVADHIDFIAHLDYVVKLIGIDHVGIASDSPVDGWGRHEVHYAGPLLADPRRWIVLAGMLRKRGYRDAELRKLLGGNFLRVLRQGLPAAPAKNERRQSNEAGIARR